MFEPKVPTWQERVMAYPKEERQRAALYEYDKDFDDTAPPGWKQMRDLAWRVGGEDRQATQAKREEFLAALDAYSEYLVAEDGLRGDRALAVLDAYRVAGEGYLHSAWVTLVVASLDGDEFPGAERFREQLWTLPLGQNL